MVTKGNRVYSPEALKTIRAIEEKYKIDWNNDAQRQQLTHLNLWENQITDISPLAHLTQLTNLSLWDNQITDLSPLVQLTQLTKLDLSENQITHIPEFLLALNLEFTLEKRNYDNKDKGKLFIGDNPIQEPPLEIVAQGNEAMRAYYASLKETKELNELKVIFIGDGGAGKTSLIKRVLDNTFDPNENMTHGITIKDRTIRVNDTPIKAHFWDFGGQEMMHSTHQFFLSHRSLYVLVLDGRKEEDSEYWLNFIKTFGGNSPVMVVLNKINDHLSFEVNRKFLLDKYPNIRGFHKTSCSTEVGIEPFFTALKTAMTQVEFIKTKWGKSWLEVKEHIETLPDNYITRERFIALCDRFGVDVSARPILTTYLDNLGIAIHFDDFNLDSIHTLNPQWITNGVYALVTSKLLHEKYGVLDKAQLHTLLDPKIYHPTTHYYILELMKKFELCFAIDDRYLLIPSALEIEEPTFDFETDDALRFEIDYGFLPPSVMATFIVKSHLDIKDTLQWRTGVVLEDASTHTQALIKVDIREKRFTILVNGEQKRDFFAVIRKRFSEINRKFTALSVAEMIPLPHSTERVDYRELIGYEQERIEDYFNGKLRKHFSVSQLLNGIERPESREKNIHVHGDYYEGDKTMGNHVSVGGNNSGIISTGDHNTITQTLTTTNTDLEALLEAFHREANTLITTLPEDQQASFKEDVETFTTKVQENKKDKYFNLSKEGLIEAAEAVGSVGVTFMGLIPKIIEFLG